MNHLFFFLYVETVHVATFLSKYPRRRDGVFLWTSTHVLEKPPNFIFENDTVPGLRILRRHREKR